ncbi:MAG: 3-keto-5-aminohexanoate cleavage protein [Pseudomonadales bacterium]
MPAATTGAGGVTERASRERVGDEVRVTAPDPVIIEAALNGSLPRSVNPRVPRTPSEVAADALACLEAGAAVIHNHTDDPVLGGDGRHDPGPYLDAWRAVLRKRPDALFYPTMAGGGPGISIEQRYAHIVALAGAGVLAQGLVDPGTTNIGRFGPDGAPRPGELVYQNTYADGVYMVEACRRLGVGLSISIFEPGFLRFVVGYLEAGRLPPGAMIKLYFGGPGVGFGLPPTAASLDAYLGMLDGYDVPWLVSLQGGDVIASGLAERALALGGHLQVGLEPSGCRERDNRTLVREAVALARRCGRPVADPEQARSLLGLP